jgi:tight adherence protein B
VAALPFLRLLLPPSSNAPLFDRTAILLMGAGASLCGGGIAWMRRLVPRPPDSDDRAALLADLAAGAIGGGASVHAALETLCRLAPGEPAAPVLRARRLVALGAPWSDALARCGDEGLRSLGTELRRAETLGVPVAGALSGLAARRRARGRSEYRAAMRRAPVLMAIPLSFCVLPAYVLLGLAPFVRGFSG